MCILLGISGITVNAQNRIPLNEPDLNKPRLFSNLPQKIAVNASELDAYFTAPIGSNTQLNLASDANQKFEGNLVSRSERTANSIQTAIIRSSNFNGARMTVSKRLNEDGTVTYIGRIISFQHGDLYELQNLEGQWFLVKKNYYDLVNE
jgi:hypothetical protein